MSQGRPIGVVVLAVLVLFAPVAMAFDNCATMTAMCEGPCGVSSCAVFAPPDWIAPGPVIGLAPQPHDPLPTSTLTSLDPPPKPFLLPA
jgi:hypothetical protein